MNPQDIPPRWYCVDRYGDADICADERNAAEQVQIQDHRWPNRAPHIAVQLAPYVPDAARAGDAEPVAWMDEYGNTFPLEAHSTKGRLSWDSAHKRGWTPLYAVPQAPERTQGAKDAEPAPRVKHLAFKLRIAEAAIVAYGAKFAMLQERRPDAPALEAIWTAVEDLLSALQIDQQGETE